MTSPAPVSDVILLGGSRTRPYTVDYRVPRYKPLAVPLAKSEVGQKMREAKFSAYA